MAFELLVLGVCCNFLIIIHIKNMLYCLPTALLWLSRLHALYQGKTMEEISVKTTTFFFKIIYIFVPFIQVTTFLDSTFSCLPLQ